MRHWLMKSEPDNFSFQDLKNRPQKKEPWDGVRNYQARNYMRDSMTIGDKVLFYHSNTKTPGVVGLAEVSSKAYPDATAFDKFSKYYDPKSNPETPRWFLVDITYKREFKTLVSLSEMKNIKKLSEMKILQKGNRLSITPVSLDEYRHICFLGDRPPSH